MHAAVVRAFGAPPRYEETADPVARGAHEVVVEVLAAGLHPRVRSQASGSHYTSDGVLPLVPGVDGVGRLPDGSLVGFVLGDGPLGSMADRTVVDRRRTFPLPADADPVVVAAAMNPAMASWVALRRRALLRPGQSVLVLGAAGNAGRLAVQVARHLGAGEVVAVARDVSGLAPACATTVVALDDPAGLQAAAADVDVVVDLLWGQPAVDVMVTVARGRRDAAKPVTWVQVGSVAGPTAAVPSAALRSTDLRLVGSGQGSVRTADIVTELTELALAVAGGAFDVRARAVPLSAVGRVWDEPTVDRVVLVP